MAIMNEKQMSLEQMCAMIEKMHANLEELEKALNEGVLEGDEKWMFPEGNYTVVAIWLLYDPRARRMFAVNERKSWVELAERLTKYVEWTVDWDCLRRSEKAFENKNTAKLSAKNGQVVLAQVKEKQYFCSGIGDQ